MIAAPEVDDREPPLPELRHTAAHVLAYAVADLFPEAKPTIGPAIENGFYYDFDRPTPFTPEDLTRLEARMREIVDADLPMTGREVTRDQAIAELGETPIRPRSRARSPKGSRSRSTRSASSPTSAGAATLRRRGASARSS